jgi:hypothetical protein
MACILSNGWSLGCRDRQGGIQKVFIGQWNGTTLATTVGTGASASIITAFTSGTSSFYTFEQELESASFTQKSVTNNDNGTVYYEQTISINLQGLDGQTVDKIRILDQGKFRIMVLDQNGRYWFLGRQNGVRTTESTPSVGKALGDMNGAMLTFLGREPLPAYEVVASAATIIIA